MCQLPDDGDGGSGEGDIVYERGGYGRHPQDKDDGDHHLVARVYHLGGRKEGKRERERSKQDQHYFKGQQWILQNLVKSETGTSECA